jgi:hypothetical protein
MIVYAEDQYMLTGGTLQLQEEGLEILLEPMR